MPAAGRYSSSHPRPVLPSVTAISAARASNHCMLPIGCQKALPKVHQQQASSPKPAIGRARSIAMVVASSCALLAESQPRPPNHIHGANIMHEAKRQKSADHDNRPFFDCAILPAIQITVELSGQVAPRGWQGAACKGKKDERKKTSQS